MQKLDLQWNWNLFQDGDRGSLIHTLQYLNRSLTELNLRGTHVVPSADLSTVFYNFSEEGNLFDIPQKLNNCLQSCALNGGSSTERKMVQLALKMNVGSPKEAIQRKIDYFLEHNSSTFFEDNEDTNHVYRCLEVIGMYGSPSTLFKSNGSLLGGYCKYTDNTPTAGMLR